MLLLNVDFEAVRRTAKLGEASNPQQDGAAGLLLQGHLGDGIQRRTGQTSQAVSVFIYFVLLSQVNGSTTVELNV